MLGGEGGGDESLRRDEGVFALCTQQLLLPQQRNSGPKRVEYWAQKIEGAAASMKGERGFHFLEMC